jgi:hypothetical protein
MTKKLFILMILLLASAPAFAQSVQDESVDTAWVRTYNGPGDTLDYTSDMVVDDSGNVYVVGTSYGIGTDRDYVTIKYLPNGDTAWVRRYNSPENGSDYGLAVAVDKTGNVYVTGYSDGFGGEPYFDWDFATIKYYPDGDTAWLRRYNGPDNGEDGGSAIFLDDSSNVYVIGRSYSIATRNDYTVIKYYPDGDTAWLRKYDGPENGDDWPYAAEADKLGNVYVTGLTCIGWSGPCDYATVRFDPDGNLVWSSTYNGPASSDDRAYDVAVDDSGNAYVTGYSWGVGTDLDYATIKYYPNGDTAWVRRYDGPASGYDEAFAVAVDSLGNVYVTGGSEEGEEYFGHFTPNHNSPIYIPRESRHLRSQDYYDPRFPRTLGDSTNSYLKQGGEVGIQYSAFATIKYHPNGDTVWVRRYSGPTEGDDFGYGIAFDRLSNVYVTGGSWGGETNSDYPIIKYYPDGSIAWVIRYNGPENSYDNPTAIVVDDFANIYLTGESCTDLIAPDFATVKYVEFLCGDVNKDGVVNETDVVYLIKYLFIGGPAPVPILQVGDVNQDEVVNVIDVVYLINYVFIGGPAPCS